MRIQIILSAALVSASLLITQGCGGQKNNGADAAGVNRAVQITPGNPVVTVGQSQAFTAQNVFGTAYSWVVIPSSLGTITSDGAFTATTPGTGVIVATARNDTRYVGTTNLRTVPVPSATITAPTYANVATTGLTASVPTQPGCNYAWTVTGGTITSAADGSQITFSTGPNAGVLTVSCSVTNAAQTVVQGTAPVQVLAPPVITSFNGLPIIVAMGNATTLIPVFQGGTGVIRPGNISVVSGEAVPLTPSSSTTYVLTVTNSAGASVSASTGILVGDPNPPGSTTVGGTTWLDPATGITMVWVPAGTFQMGTPGSDPDASANEGPSHTVTFAQGFWISQSKISQGGWGTLMGSNPSFFQPTDCSKFLANSSLPVEQVSWEDVQSFLAQSNARLGWHALRLPSEAEWEYAYRAGTSTRFFWGDDPALQSVGLYAWYKNNAFDSTQSLNQLASNAWNLKDMAGNAMEWIADAYQPDYQGAPVDGSAVLGLATVFRTLRGGAWNDAGQNLRATTRYALAQSAKFRTIGFRVVRPHRDAPVLTATKASLASLPHGGGQTLLSWNAQGATKVWIDHGVGDVTGTASKSVSVTSTTTFVIVAQNASGWVMSTVKVEVQ